MYPGSKVYPTEASEGWADIQTELHFQIWVMLSQTLKQCKNQDEPDKINLTIRNTISEDATVFCLLIIKAVVALWN